MDPFLVHEKPITNGASTHAIVVGVGAYPRLFGGSPPLYAGHSGMGQLSSPPLSALRMAEWLIATFNHPRKPLASVSLLVSDATPTRFTHPGDGVQHDVSPATFENVEKALRAWKKRGDSDPDNLVVFYFCGHGIASSAEFALLMSDYGEDPNDALGSALDFRKFHLGMEACAAREQCFIVDACRQGDATLDAASGYAGNPVFQPTPRPPGSENRRTAVFYSTLAGDKAYARKGEISRYTQSLVRGFGGAGADDETGEWWVDTAQLFKAITRMMEREHLQGIAPAQVPFNTMAVFALHKMQKTPRVPVVVTCDPDTHNQSAHVSYTGPETGECPPFEGDGGAEVRPELGWDLDLPIGAYTFSANAADGSSLATLPQLNVRPTRRLVRLGIET